MATGRNLLDLMTIRVADCPPAVMIAPMLVYLLQLLGS
jgi:uncharacterized membrane protein YqgA involved in biofilm formation